MGIKVTGVDAVVAELRYKAERIADNARKQMHRQADFIVEEARLNAPVDKHNLEKAIQKKVSYGYRGRLQIDIEVGGIVNGVNVDLYAAEIHENYESMNPGKGTIQKREDNPDRYVGGKFLERALEANRERVLKAIKNEVDKSL